MCLLPFYGIRAQEHGTEQTVTGNKDCIATLVWVSEGQTRHESGKSANTDPIVFLGINSRCGRSQESNWL